LYQVGVYAGGPWPGQPGTAVVDGHSGAPDQVGVLEHLNRVKVGDMVTMVNVSGQKTLFKVTTSKAYPATAATAGVLFAKTTTATMNIISCYGNWDAKSQTYDQRWLLTTELVK
jgi:sortase (surface protein transpeptidase)